jgi:RNA polymerase sigma-70 factor (ECF subfamily)
MFAAQGGDKTAYETLLRDCIPFIRQVARAQGVHPDGIDDIVQETLLAIHGARQTYDPSRSFTAWLRVIAQRRAVDGLRRSGRTTAREVHAPLAYENHPDVGTGPEAAILERDRTARLDSAIGALPAAQRNAIEHFVLRAHPAATMAARTEGSLRVNWHRAIKSLRAHIGEND